MNNLRITIANRSERGQERLVKESGNGGAKPKNGNWKNRGGRGRNATNSAAPRKSANDRLIRPPNAVEVFREPTPKSKNKEKNNNAMDELCNDIEMMEIQPPPRTDTDSPNCICLRPLKMVICR